MKKLMFGAAVAATSIAFGASSQPAAQVYDVTLNIKSTAAATATKINNKANPLAVASATDTAIDIIYRKQASYTWKGLIWGCDCETIDGVWEIVDPCDDITGKLQDTVKGCIIWDTKTKEVKFVGDNSTVVYDDEDDALPNVSQVPGTGFGWEFLHCIGKDGKTIEGAWTMIQNAPICDKKTAEMSFMFAGAGFGTVSPVVLTDTYEDADGKKVTDYSWDCSSYIKKISGNFAGVMWAPSLNTSGSASGCAFCGGTVVDGACATADDIWAWCENFGGSCGCDLQLFQHTDYTAAYGTWTVAYNSSVSKKLSTLVDLKKIEKTYVYSITQAYNFKNLPNVLAMIELIEAEVLGDTKTEDCEDAEKALEEATTAYNKALATSAQAELDYFAAVSNELNVTDVALEADRDAARVANAVASRALDTAKSNWIDWTNNLETAKAALVAAGTATGAWEIVWIDTVTEAPVKGATYLALTNKLAQINMNAVKTIEYSTWGAQTKDDFADDAVALERAINAEKYAVEQVDKAEATLDKAKTADTEAAEALETAQYRCDNSLTLQKEAAVKVAATKLAYDAAQADLTAKATAKTAAEAAKKAACND